MQSAAPGLPSEEDALRRRDHGHRRLLQQERGGLLILLQQQQRLLHLRQSRLGPWGWWPSMQAPRKTRDFDASYSRTPMNG